MRIMFTIDTEFTGYQSIKKVTIFIHSNSTLSRPFGKSQFTFVQVLTIIRFESNFL